MAEPAGLSISTITKRVKRRGIAVRPNPPKLLQELTVQDLPKLPTSKASRKRQIAKGMILRSCHLRDDFGATYPYLRQIAEKLLSEGRRVYVEVYAKSTYIPKGYQSKEANRRAALARRAP